MVRVYGSATVEPGGMELDNDRYTCDCPQCGMAASGWHIETCEAGAINLYVGMKCQACGHREGSHPSDEYAELERDYEEGGCLCCGRRAGKSLNRLGELSCDACGAVELPL